MAVAGMKDLARETGRPIPLDLALRLVELAAPQNADAYEVWACRWLARWLVEARGVTIDRAADIAAALAELPVEPSALETIKHAD